MTRTIAFASPEEKAELLRRMRLFSEDIAELSSAIAIPIALSRRADDAALIAALNKNPAFWNSILSGLQTSSHITVGRIHDNTRNAYLKEIKRFLGTRKEGTEILERLNAVETATRQS